MNDYTLGELLDSGVFCADFTEYMKRQPRYTTYAQARGQDAAQVIIKHSRYVLTTTAPVTKPYMLWAARHGRDTTAPQSLTY